jgi:ABC-2 type transport system permease protein
VLVEKAAALAVSVVILGLVLFVVTAAASELAGMQISTSALASGVAGVTLLGLEFSGLALASGAATGRRGLAIGAASSAAVAAYVLYVTGSLVDAVQPWRVLSPFDQAIREGPIGNGLAPTYGWVAAGAIAALVASIPFFERRDVMT